MEKKKINVFEVISLLAFAGGICFMFLSLRPRTENYETLYLTLAIICGVIWTVAVILQEKIALKDDRERHKNLYQALSFAVQKQRGTKDFFINVHGEEAYNRLLQNGLIHQLQKETNVWEVTMLAAPKLKGWAFE